MHERQRVEKDEIPLCIFLRFRNVTILFLLLSPLSRRLNSKGRNEAWIGEVYVHIRSIRIN